MSWRWLNASIAGTSHADGGIPCQDDCLVDVISGTSGEVLIAITSDGAGSAAHAEDGSALACESLYRAVADWAATGGPIDDLTREKVEAWILCLRTAIEQRANETDASVRDFACTLVAAIVSEHVAAFLQIGDGAIVVGKDDVCEVVFWPDTGEYANMTFFTTDDDWQKHVLFEIRNAQFDDIALMTDGLQRLALHYDSRTPHVPFFAPMFGALQKAAAGFAVDFEPALVSFLGSAAVNERTDDDKTLVLATRRAAEEAHGDR
ncbi:MAG: protein phosphatase 2C domain-containing protein [Acidobacteria bacterium]|nr:protein phosphatase 2C domain-containing protein [Acidobacteriota bacterium]